MIPKVYFYTTSTEGPPEGAYFQDLIINLATGFQQLGIEFYANYNYWQISPDSDRTLLKASPDVTHHDCDIVVLERQYYEENRCLPEGLFAPNRQYKTVYLDCNDGIQTLSWLPKFRNFDFIFKTHYSKHTKYPKNFYPWAFGLSERVLKELSTEVPWTEKQPSLLVNFRNQKFSHSLRGYIQKTFVTQIQEVFSINTASDDASAFPQDPYHYLRWSQTGRRHYPNYYKRLLASQACACFGGFFLGPWFTDFHDRISHYISKGISILGVKTNRIGQWDSWRLWESMAAGCVTFHVDFEKYGFELPVMPENWRHYIGIDLDNMSESIERIIEQPELLEHISREGRAWAIENYAPKATALRFLSTVAALQPDQLNQLKPEVNLVQ
ncbi:MAG: glycosyltransferase family 1 protein [Cyanobacteria bacterium P01_E01_bin.35]